MAEPRFCPCCGGEVPTAATVCTRCGATFEVTRKGYCSACHAVNPVDAQDACLSCGRPVIDVRTHGRPMGPPVGLAGAAPPAPPAAAEAASAPPPPAPAPATAPTLPVTPGFGLPEVRVWQPLLARAMVGAALNSVAFIVLLAAAWFTQWAEGTGSVVVLVYRGPLLLPFVVMAAVALLLWRAGTNQRPRGGRTLTRRQWRERWRQNRKTYGARGAFKPVVWGVARTLIAALVWLGAAVVIAVNLQRIGSTAGLEIAAGGWVALAATPFGALGCLLCMPVSRRRLVQVDADGGYYGTLEQSAGVAPHVQAPFAPATVAAAAPGAMAVVAPPPPRRSKAVWVVVPLALALLAATVGALLLVPLLADKGFTDDEMAYAAPYVRQKYRGTFFTLEGRSLALQAELADMRGRRFTKSSIDRAESFFREGDAYFAKLLALESPSSRFDRLHALWQTAVRLRRAALKEFARAYRRSRVGGSFKGSDLADRAEKRDKASWQLFWQLQKEEATAEQIREVVRMMERSDRESRGQ